jgi:hypothetical protein
MYKYMYICVLTYTQMRVYICIYICINIPEFGDPYPVHLNSKNMPKIHMYTHTYIYIPEFGYPYLLYLNSKNMLKI